MKCRAALKHPAILEVRMKYEGFDASSEPVLCTWMDLDAAEYTIHAMGDATAKMDYKSVQSIVAYIVESILRLKSTRAKRLQST